MSKKWLVPIVIFMNSIFLLGIDDLGVQIEEPFSILPLANICYNIQSTAQMVLQSAGIDWFQGTPQHQAALAAAAAASVTASAVVVDKAAEESVEEPDVPTGEVEEHVEVQVVPPVPPVNNSSTSSTTVTTETQLTALAELAAEMSVGAEEELTFDIVPPRAGVASSMTNVSQTVEESDKLLIEVVGSIAN